jgi:exopolysaccharide biosynthesis polyprenyl glycosylphosphotransferase
MNSMFDDQKNYLSFIYIISDLICLVILYYFFIPLLFKVTIGQSFFLILTEPMMGNYFEKRFLFIGLSLVFIFLPVVLMVVFKIYHKIDCRKFQTICYQSIILCVIAMGVLFLQFLFFAFTLKESFYFLAKAGLLLLSMVVLYRVYIYYILKKDSSKKKFIKHLLLVGTGSKSISIFNYIENHPESGLRVTGFLTNQDNEIGKMISNKKILGKVDQMIDLVLEHYTDCVLYAGDKEYIQNHESLIKSCSMIGLDFATTELELHKEIINKEIIFFEHIGIVELKIVKFVYISPRKAILKRVFDFTVSSILIIMSLPFWIVISILIKLTSPGPVFFRQERIGKYGEKFILFKFRSMVENAENMQEALMHLNEMDGLAFKIKDDPRQTKIGKFLRKSSLDEFPQLFNVFKGDISLVGPRPAIESEVIRYRPIERKRLAMMQGITCIWQASGRNKIKFDEWMKLDLMYIDTWSLKLDFIILIKTIPAVLLKKGAF